MNFQLDKHRISGNKDYLLQQGNTCPIHQKLFYSVQKPKDLIVNFSEEQILQDRHALKAATLLSHSLLLLVTKATMKSEDIKTSSYL